jgi:hypothetical protein
VPHADDVVGFGTPTGIAGFKDTTAQGKMERSYRMQNASGACYALRTHAVEGSHLLSQPLAIPIVFAGGLLTAA